MPETSDRSDDRRAPVLVVDEDAARAASRAPVDTQVAVWIGREDDPELEEFSTELGIGQLGAGRDG